MDKVKLSLPDLHIRAINALVYAALFMVIGTGLPYFVELTKNEQYLYVKTPVQVVEVDQAAGQCGRLQLKAYQNTKTKVKYAAYQKWLAVTEKGLVNVANRSYEVTSTPGIGDIYFYIDIPCEVGAGKYKIEFLYEYFMSGLSKSSNFETNIFTLDK